MGKLHEERIKDKAQHQLIRRLMHKLRAEQEALKRVKRKRTAAWHARARLIELLRNERARRAKQHAYMTKLKRELRHALQKERLAERDLHKQIELTRHLKKMFSCGRLRTLASREEEYTRLLKHEGWKLKHLVQVLYNVDKKVTDLRRMAKQRRKELRRAERYAKWARLMIRKEKSYLRRLWGVLRLVAPVFVLNYELCI